jgi:hypothetical protein
MIYILFEETKDLSHSLIFSLSPYISVDIKKYADDVHNIQGNEALYRWLNGMQAVYPYGVQKMSLFIW